MNPPAGRRRDADPTGSRGGAGDPPDRPGDGTRGAEAVPTTTFAGATGVREVRPGRYACAVDPAWSIGPAPNGGYLLAVATRAALAGSPHPHPLAVSAAFLRPPRFEPAEVSVRTLRAGRSVSHLEAVLEQDGEPVVECLVSATTLPAAGQAAGPTYVGSEPPRLPDPDRCVRIPTVGPSGVTLALMAEIDLRLDPAVLGFAVGRPTGTMTMHGWFDLPDQPTDVLALLVALDALPPTSFQLGLLSWAPTVQLSASVRQLPAPGPVIVRHRTSLLSGGWFDEVAEVWDSAGSLVAQSRQVAGARPGPHDVPVPAG